MGGIIVVDFIDMSLAEDRQMLYERMCKDMQKDRARHNILPLSKFGLMQITRQRVRPVMEVNVEETCPTCNGTGKIMHDAWRSFWERYGHLRGFELGAAMDEKGPKTPEEITCTKCGGSGRALTPQGEKIAEKVRALHEKLLDIEGWQ